MSNVHAYFFSPTGTTERVVRRIAAGISAQFEDRDLTRYVDFTPLIERQSERSILIKDSLLVLGIPVYAGRVPNILLNYLRRFRAENSDAVIVVLYGNRAFDDALVELRTLLDEGGFNIVGAGAFVGAHAFSERIAAGRPDAEDMIIMDTFVESIVERLKNQGGSTCEVPGEVPYRPYYRPLDNDGNPFDFKAIKPETQVNCIHCGLCAIKCPVQSISHEDHKTILGKCIKCCSCVKKCPVGAKSFADLNFIKHKHELEEQCATRQESVFFI